MTIRRLADSQIGRLIGEMNRTVLAVAVLGLAGMPTAAQEIARFASATEMVSLNIAVTDQSRQCFTRYPAYWNAGWDGCPVPDLAKEACEVLEDGVAQHVELFHRSDVPIALSLLIDARLTADARTRDAQDAAIALVRKLRATDVADVAGFASGGEVYEPFTGDRRTLEGAIRRITPFKQAPVPDPLQLLRRRLESAPAGGAGPIRRDAIVFLTDGGDASPLMRFEATLNLAKRSQAAIYVIALTGEGQLEGNREFTSALRQLATVTGGRAFFPEDVRSLASMHAQIYDEISAQYTLGYISSNQRRDGRWRAIAVRVNRLDAGVRTRLGYFAPQAQ